MSIEKLLKQVSNISMSFGTNINEISLNINNFIDELQNNNIISIEEYFKNFSRNLNFKRNLKNVENYNIIII